MRITPAESRRRTAVRVEAAVLAYLRDHPEGATVGAIVDDTGESISAVLTVLKRLERSGEVEYVGEKTNGPGNDQGPTNDPPMIK